MHKWIIDTGATNHNCFQLNVFLMHKWIGPVIVRLPNYSHLLAEYLGTIHFS